MATNEYDIAQGNIKRKRGLVDALQAQSLTPSQGGMVGQVYVGPGLLEALSKPLLALASNYAGGNLDKEELQNSQSRQSALVDALSGLQNQPGTSGFTTEALGSQFPELQQAGMANLQAQLSPRAQESYTAPVMDAQGNLQQFSNRGNVKNTGVQGYNKPSYGNVKTVIGADGTPQLMAIDNEGNTKVLPGEAYIKPPAQTNINNNMPKQEGSFGKKLGEKDAERYDNANTILQSEGRMTDMISRIRNLEDSPVLRGGLADLGIKAAEIGSSLGFKTPEKVANAEQLRAILQQGVVDLIKEGGRGITDEDAKRMQQTWPDLLQTPEGARQVRQQMEEINARNIRQAKTTQNVLKQRYPDAFPQAAGSTQNAPQQGDVVDGYQYQGGDPASPNSWRKQ